MSAVELQVPSPTSVTRHLRGASSRLGYAVGCSEVPSRCGRQVRGRVWCAVPSNSFVDSLVMDTIVASLLKEDHANGRNPVMRRAYHGLRHVSYLASPRISCVGVGLRDGSGTEAFDAGGVDVADVAAVAAVDGASASCVGAGAGAGGDVKCMRRCSDRDRLWYGNINTPWRLCSGIPDRGNPRWLRVVPGDVTRIHNPPHCLVQMLVAIPFMFVLETQEIA